MNKPYYPDEINGHSIELKQIYLCLKRMVKDEFDLNEVPAEIVGELNRLIDAMDAGESRIFSLIMSVRLIPGHEEFAGQ